MAKIKKIVFLLEAYFNRRDYERFGIRILEDQGFQVEVWDCTYFLTSEEYRRILPIDPVVCHNLTVFRDEYSALEALRGLGETGFVVCLVHFNLNSRNLYRAMTKAKIPYCIHGFALPRSLTRADIFASKVRNISVKKLMRRIRDFWLLNPWFYRSPDIILGCGQDYRSSGFNVSRKSRVLWTHSLDYDIHLALKDKPLAPDAALGVFLDEYLPYHPDFINAGQAPAVTPEEYYPLLRNFFEYLQREYRVRIVIAAHPRSDYGAHPDCFNQFPVVRGQTARLVRDCAFVLMHHSTAVNFAVLYRKPIIFMTTDKLDTALLEEPSVAWLADFFHKKMHNLNRPRQIDWKAEMSVDEQAYRRYQNDYIKKDGSPDLPFWQILAEYLKGSPL